MKARPGRRGGELVASGGQAAPRSEVVDAPGDGVALLAVVRVGTGRAVSSAASPQAVADLVGRLRDDRADPATSQVVAIARDELARPARTVVGRVPGRPGPGTRMRAVTVRHAPAARDSPEIVAPAILDGHGRSR